MTPPTLLSDIGHVLVRVDRERPLRALSEYLGIPGEKLAPYFDSHPLHYRLESGEITPPEFLQQISEQVDSRGSLSLDELSNILGKSFSLNSPLMESIDQFRPPLQVILLSNTNAIDIPYIEKQFGLLSWADEHVLSYEVHLRKPDHRIYVHALREYGLDPDRTLFIDDQQLNIDAARDSGLRAEVYHSPDQVTGLLSRLCETGNV